MIMYLECQLGKLEEFGCSDKGERDGMTNLVLMVLETYLV